jgi:flagellar biosynthesis protein FlhG
MKSKQYTVNKTAVRKMSDLHANRGFRSTKVISFTSGKGGVGKTSLACGTALALTSQGNRVLLIDADLSLANVDLMLGLTPKGTLKHVLTGDAKLKDILLTTSEGLDVIPAASGFQELTALNLAQKMLLQQSLEELAHEYDFILLDTAAGIGSDVLFFNAASHEVVCIVNREPTSLTDAYALIKVLSRSYGEKEVSILVNNVKDSGEAERTFARLQNAVDRFLHTKIKYLGFVPTDETVREAVLGRTAFQTASPSCQASLAVSRIAKTLEGSFYETSSKGGLQFLFDKLLEAEG